MEKASEKMKTKRIKTEYPPVDKVFSYDLTELYKDWSNIAIVVAHGRLYRQSSV